MTQPAAILPPCMVGSPILAAGLPPINTEVDPGPMVSGGPAHVHILVEVAAGIPPINTVGTPGGKIGPPTCGGVAGVAGIGQVCMSPTLAAGFPIIFA